MSIPLFSVYATLTSATPLNVPPEIQLSLVVGPSRVNSSVSGVILRLHNPSLANASSIPPEPEGLYAEWKLPDGIDLTQCNDFSCNANGGSATQDRWCVINGQQVNLITPLVGSVSTAYAFLFNNYSVNSQYGYILAGATKLAGGALSISTPAITIDRLGISSTLKLSEMQSLTLRDSDGDGVSNRAELVSGTNPFVYETDSDHDGLTNPGEYTAQTNPLNYDSDGDLLPDGWEVTNGLNPKSSISNDGTAGDYDNDGIQNQYEYVLNFNPKSATSNGTADVSRDRDGDGIPDYWEAKTGNLTYDPVLKRSVFVRKLDWDIPDGLEDYDGDGYCNLAEYLKATDPLIFDTGGFTDVDGDGLTAGQEALYGSNPNLADTNGDGLADGVSAQAGINPVSLDPDNDGLTNTQEAAQGTNPLIADTDGDGVIDSADAFPLDAGRTLAPLATAGDITPPVITLTTPEGAAEL